MCSFRRIPALFLAIVLGASLPAFAQPQPGKISEEKYDTIDVRGIKAPMRDGVKLSLDIFRPTAPDGQKVPAIFIFTPYSNNSGGMMSRAKFFARRGYAVVIGDTRGRFDSEGEWNPFGAKHKEDGHDVVEWIAKQPWCTGKVGMVGGSYLGWTQWWTASQAPPSLKCIIPEVAPPDAFYNAPYQQGIVSGWFMDWLSMMSGRTGQIMGEGPYGGFAPYRQRDFMKLPYIKMNEFRGSADSPWFETVFKQNLLNDPYWTAIAYERPENFSKVTVPSLSITGWYDANYPGSPRNYLGMKQYGATPEARKPKLVIGPWQHAFNSRSLGKTDFGPDAQIAWDGYCCRWFDHYLLGKDNGVEKDPAVQLFVMGRNKWRSGTDWPLPETKWTKYYLHSRGKANSVRGDGTLDTTAPASEPTDKYVYDPALPALSPYTGGHLEDGPVDSRLASRGDDVLVYTTEPLQSDVEVCGPITAKLFAATSAKDTDWMMRLIDVHPDGFSAFLCDGVMRARYRDPKNHGAYNPARLSTIEPGKALEYTLEFWRGTGNLFKKGHRIRIEISSSYYPYYLPNLNTGADNIALETRRVIANQTIYHDAERPSHVVLPVIPAK